MTPYRASRRSEHAVGHDQRRARRNKALVARQGSRKEQHQLAAVIIDMPPDPEQFVALRGARLAARDALGSRRGRVIAHADGSILLWRREDARERQERPRPIRLAVPGETSTQIGIAAPNMSAASLNPTAPPL
jgi:hypothetical protein